MPRTFKRPGRRAAVPVLALVLLLTGGSLAAVRYDVAGRLWPAQHPPAPSLPPVVRGSVTAGAGRLDLVQALTRTPTPTPRPAATPEPAIERPKVAAQGFVQDRQQVTVAFVLENPNAEITFTRLMARIVLQDEAGSALQVQQHPLDLLLPGERLGAVQAVSAPAGARVAFVAVDVTAARPQRQEGPGQPPFLTEAVTYIAGRTSGRVSGRVVNPHDNAIDKLKLIAVAYDGAGQIIGGGTATLNHLPARGAGAADVPVKTVVPPARVELFATLTAASKVY